MKETKIIYHLDGKEVEKEVIDWQRTMTITLKGDEPNNAYVTYRDNKGHSTRFKEAGKCPNGINSKEEKDGFFKRMEALEKKNEIGCDSTTFKVLMDPEFPRQNVLVGNDGFDNTCWHGKEEDKLKSSEDYKKAVLAEAFPWLVDYEDTIKTPYLKTTNGGIKETEGKLDYELDWSFLTQMAERMATNKGKYKPYNWQEKIDVDKLKQAMFRHVLEVMNGNYEDEGRMLGHIESVALNAMMINYQLKNK